MIARPILLGDLRNGAERRLERQCDGFVALGGEVRRGVVVKDLTAQTDGVEVATDETRETFDAVVIAAGPWTQNLVSLPLTIERQVMAWLEIAPDDLDLLTPERFPVFIRETDGVRQF